MSPGITTLAVFHVAEPSGAVHSLRPRLEWLASRGDLTVVTPGPGYAAGLYSDIARTVAFDYRAAVLPSGPAATARWAWETKRDVGRFRALFQRERPELVVCVSAMLPGALVAARIERRPTIVHAAELLHSDPTRRVPARIGGWALSHLTAALGDGIAACSAAAAREYAFRWETPVAVTYPGISPGQGGDGAALRTRLGIGRDDPLVVALGSISERRGQDVLVDAMRIVRRGAPGARCLIFGAPFPRHSDLAFAERLNELRRAHGLEDMVRLCPPSDDVASIYAAADVVVNPARVAESFGRVACEALVAGCPVVSSCVGAVPEVLRDGETALLVPPDRPPALADAILELVRDPDYARSLARRGAADVQVRFGPETGLEAFKRLVAAVA